MIRNNLKFIAFLAIFGLIGGYFTALYSVEMLDTNALEQAVSQVGSVEILILVSTVQSLLYAVVLGVIGILISNKIGLWRDVFPLEAKPLIYTVVVSIIGGTFFILADVLLFASLFPLCLIPIW